MKWSIHSFKPYKSPGPDGITPHIQQAGQIAINWLKKIFQSILAVGELTTAWQETKVVFIPKAGRATHTTAKVFRPIRLTSFLLKSFERMISLHIRAFNDVLSTAIKESLTELGVEPPMAGLIHKLLIRGMVTATLGTST